MTIHPDAVVVLYGGAAIGGGCYLLGAVTEPVIATTGLGIMGASMVVAGVWNRVSDA